MGLVQPGEEALAGPNSSPPVPRREVIKERAPGFPQQRGVRQEEETETREVRTKDGENFTATAVKQWSTWQRGCSASVLGGSQTW